MLPTMVFDANLQLLGSGNHVITGHGSWSTVLGYCHVSTEYLQSMELFGGG